MMNGILFYLFQFQHTWLRRTGRWVLGLIMYGEGIEFAISEWQQGWVVFQVSCTREVHLKVVI